VGVRALEHYFARGSLVFLRFCRPLAAHLGGIGEGMNGSFESPTTREEQRDSSSVRDENRPCLMHVFPSFAVGGVPNRIAAIINRLGDAYCHKILALDGQYGAAATLDSHAKVDLMACEGRNKSVIRTIQRIRWRLRNETLDALMTYNWGAIEWALVNNVLGFAPHVHFESGFGKEEESVLLWRRNRFRRLALFRTRRIVVPSQTLARIAEDAWRLPREKVQVLPNGVDCEEFSGQPGCVTNAEFRASPKHVVVGTVAPLRPEKSLDRLLRCFAALDGKREARLVIVGDGGEQDRLERAAGELGISDRTVFAGHRGDVAHVLRGLDIFAMTSDTEQMPNSLLQAMATGRPVIATDVGDIVRMVAPENRPYIVAKTDEQGFTDRLENLLMDRDRRLMLGERNQACARTHYGMDKMVAAYRTLFDETLQSA
jgi:glycosyltransferase involved in cell wall biosynthesis